MRALHVAALAVLVATEAGAARDCLAPLQESRNWSCHAELSTGASVDYCTEVTNLFGDDPASRERVVDDPHFPEMSLTQMIDRLYTTDVFMHTWDLARATGQDATLDAGHCAELLTGMEPLDEMLRASGQYGPRVPVPDDAPSQDRLIAFIGRDPAWSPA